MYRMRQREFIAAVATARARAARARCSTLAGQHTAHRLRRAHAHAAGAADHDRALPAGGDRAARARHQRGSQPPTSPPTAIRSAPARSPAPASRSIAHRTSELLGFDGPTGNTYGSIATVDYLLESVSATGVAGRRPRPRRPGPAAVVHDGVRLPAAWRRLRAVQQHHAAEAQSGGARARARDRQQGGRPGAGDRRPPSTTRRSATSSTPRTTCSRWWRRCSATPRATVTLVGGGDARGGLRRRAGWRRAPARAARR